MMIKLSVFLLSLFLPALVLAQDAPIETEEEEIRRYTVEVIIFRYVEDVGLGSEVFLPDEIEEPESEDGLDLIGESEDAPEPAAAQPEEVAEELEPEPLPDIELVLLDEESYELIETFERLENLDAYEPLMHFGWTQATWPEEQTEAIPLHLFARPPAELDGSLMLYLGRYLHLVVNLQLHEPGTGSGGVPLISGGEGFTVLGEVDEVQVAPVYYRISEDRILRNGEIRYYDHPKFGLLARVARIEEEAQMDQGELLGYPVQ
jgi:hypothetical protein